MEGLALAHLFTEVSFHMLMALDGYPEFLSEVYYLSSGAVGC
jgi:hypothetical protein